MSAMGDVVRGAVNLCTAAYVCVGVFGYIALCDVDFGGKADDTLLILLLDSIIIGNQTYFLWQF